ncbi:MAG: metallophosphoesterase [candidate division Zixibacteria bacterium]|nr:metallophosphoesterase [candidate division Zixibacteria bacterium]
MILFLLIFLLVYGGLHLYMFLKAKTAFAFGTKTSISLLLFMAIMVFAPILVRLFEKPGVEHVARLIAYIGYTWMGILFLFFSVSIVIDFCRLLAYLAGFVAQKDFSNLTSITPYHFLIPFLLSIFITTYGYFEAKDIRIERMTIKTSKIPEEISRLKIVQVSDIHLGVIVGEEKLKKILELVKKEEPDVLVSTGDLVDGEMCNLTELVGLLKDIKSRYGKFAITGNHEFYAGLDRALAFTEDAGFTILRAEGITVAGFLNIAGVDDPAGKPFGLFKDISEKELLSKLPQENFTLLLKHRPIVDETSLGYFDLQLSGHAHKGQIFPFGLITKAIYPTDDGCLELENGSYLCVSRGAGTWGPPIRFLAPPDIMVIELVHENGD